MCSVKSAFINTYKNQINLSNGKTTFDPVMNGLAKTSFPETLPFVFWEIEDDDAFEFFITELSENMEMSDLDDSDFLELPLGYAISRYLLSFEFSCASEGWTAFANIDEQDLMLVLDFYEKVGLKDESLAINTAYKAWIIAVDDGVPVAFTKFIKYNGGLESQFTAWNYHKPKMSLGKNIIWYEMGIASYFGFDDYLYIGQGYENGSKYKADIPGFEWWTGSEWSKDVDRYKELCSRDSAINTIDDITRAYNGPHNS